MATLEQAGYDHYELSNFGKPGFHSRNNTAYWEGKPYLGIGPAAHSFDGTTRRWNVASNPKYIRALATGGRDFETETLTLKDRYNERIMTGLRTRRGVSLSGLEEEFGARFAAYASESAGRHIESGYLEIRDGHLRTTPENRIRLSRYLLDRRPFPPRGFVRAYPGRRYHGLGD